MGRISKTLSEYPVTALFMVICVIMGVIQVTVYTQFGEAVHNQYFVLASDNPTNIISWLLSMFSHGGIAHLLINVFVLSMFGTIVERSLGSVKTALFFVLGGIAASATQVAAVLLSNSEPMSLLGASGFIAATLGYVSIGSPRLKILLFFIIPMSIIRGMLLFLAFSISAIIIYGFGAGGFAHTAHIGGIVFGMLIGVLLNPTIDTSSLQDTSS